MEDWGPWQNGSEKKRYVSCRLWYGPTVFIHSTTCSVGLYCRQIKEVHPVNDLYLHHFFFSKERLTVWLCSSADPSFTAATTSNRAAERSHIVASLEEDYQSRQAWKKQEKIMKHNKVLSCCVQKVPCLWSLFLAKTETTSIRCMQSSCFTGPVFCAVCAKCISTDQRQRGAWERCRKIVDQESQICFEF